MASLTLKISEEASLRLKRKAKEKGLSLDEYLLNLIAFSETLDDMTSTETRIVLHESRIDPTKDITISVRHLKGM